MPEAALPTQHGIWFNEQLGGIGTVYSMPFAVTFDGAIDVDALLAACRAVIARHPALGSAVEVRDGVPYLVPAVVPPEVEVVSGSSQAMEEIVRLEISRPFDLEKGPLIRLTLITEGPERHRLLVVAHHLIFDGESTSVFLGDLAGLYRSGEAPAISRALPPEEEPSLVEAAREFWRSREHGAAEVILPGLVGTPPMAAGGAAVEFELDGDLLEGLAGEIGASRFEIVLASLHALLHRYGNAEATIAVDLGTRTSGTRDHLGCFVNELPVTASPRPGWTFRDLVEHQRSAYGLRSGLPGLYRLRRVPLSRAATGVRPGVTLAPVSLGYRRRAAAPDFGVPSQVDWVLFNDTVRGALRVHVVDGPERFGVVLQYNPRFMGEQDAERVAEHWRTLLGAAAADPGARLADLPVLGLQERRWLLETCNDTAAARSEATLPELLATQAGHTPDAPAAVQGENVMTYAELDVAVEGLAGRLRAEGVAPGSLVAVSAGRSLRALVGLLAVLRAGGAYLPLDPNYPAERLAFVLADSGAHLLLTEERLLGRLDGVRTLTLESLESLESLGSTAPVAGWPAPGDLAYVIYTSGSTGRPKGVEIEHRALANLLTAMGDRFEPGVWLALTSLSFDISALELYLPLVTGGQVVLAGDAEAGDGRELVRLVRDRGVTHVQATPSGWRMLLDSGFDAPRVTALAGGEVLPAPLAREILSRAGRLVNVYGPTETTIWSTSAEIREPVESVPIGTPLDNTRVYVLDDALGLLPTGVPGELCVAGDGVARGYRGRPELTAERFADDPYGPGRLYRTGDRVRRRADGQLEFLGRADNQIKLRGHRIELGEIEARLLEHPGVREAAVVAREDSGGDPRIVAYVVPAVTAPTPAPGARDPEPSGGLDGPPTHTLSEELRQRSAPGLSEELRELLARVLPAYMIPGAFQVLRALPLTPGGKLDRDALPEVTDWRPPEVTDGRVSPEGADGAADGAAPAGLAGRIREIWCEVLVMDDVGLDDDLFELGGHSFTITQISARLRTRLGLDLPPHVFYDASTISALVATIEGEYR